MMKINSLHFSHKMETKMETIFFLFLFLMKVEHELLPSKDWIPTLTSSYFAQKQLPLFEICSTSVDFRLEQKEIIIFRLFMSKMVIGEGVWISQKICFLPTILVWFIRDTKLSKR